MWQGSLLDAGERPGPGELGESVERRQLTNGAWVDLRPGWFAGADELFERLVEAVPWRAERRPMYERIVDVPRLLCFYDEGDELPAPELVAAREALNAHYLAELSGPDGGGPDGPGDGGPGDGERFVTAGLCLYRDGRDSVAWHGDRIGRGRRADTKVAILSLGAPRALLLRPRGGGRSLRFEVGQGDLLVMGGSCQRTWEHSVPKTARPVGPRLSVQFRPRGVR